MLAFEIEPPKCSQFSQVRKVKFTINDGDARN